MISPTWKGCLFKGGDRLGHALAINVDVAAFAVFVNVALAASGDGRVLYVKVFLKGWQV